MAKVNKYIINIDNFFFDKYGGLNNGVLSFLKTLDRKCEIMFITNDEREKYNEKLKKLNKILNSFKIEEITPDYGICCSGAVVTRRLNFFANRIPVNEAWKILKIIFETEPKAKAKVYSLNDKALVFEKKSLSSFFCLKDKREYRDFTLLHVSNFQDYFANENILSIVVDGLSEENKQIIAGKLWRNPNFKISFEESHILFCKKSKKDVITHLLGCDLSQVVYIGTSKSDIEAMKACGVSIAYSIDNDVVMASDFTVFNIGEINNVLNSVNSKVADDDFCKQMN